MIIDKNGHFEFYNYLYVQGCLGVIDNSVLRGEVNMQLPLYRQWFEEYAAPKGIKDDLLTWTVMFIPALEYSVIRFLDAEITRMES